MTVYFDAPGPQNTDETLKLALSACREGIAHLVFASTRGRTARALLKTDFEGLNVVCVTHHAGYRAPGELEMNEGVSRALSERGVRLLTTTHLFGGVGRAVGRRWGGLSPGETVANTLRLLGEGMKVVVEIGVMALDAGLVPHGVEVVSVAGKAAGADTAVVLKPAHAKDFFDTRVRRVICAPVVG